MLKLLFFIDKLTKCSPTHLGKSYMQIMFYWRAKHSNFKFDIYIDHTFRLIMVQSGRKREITLSVLHDKDSTKVHILNNNNSIKYSLFVCKRRILALEMMIYHMYKLMDPIKVVRNLPKHDLHTYFQLNKGLDMFRYLPILRHHFIAHTKKKIQDDTRLKYTSILHTKKCIKMERMASFWAFCTS